MCIDDEKLCLLLYADDIVLLAERGNEIQYLLNIWHLWCQNRMIDRW